MADDTILILADGEWGIPARLRDAVARADSVIAADGGWAKARAAGVRVDAVIGDLDSLSPEDRARLSRESIEVHRYPPDKDQVDLELAIDFALARSPAKILVYGGIGGRLDHTLSNVFLLEKVVERNVHVELIADEETAWLIRDKLVLPHVRPGDRISLIPFSIEAAVRTSGLKYPLDDEVLVRSAARGVSNVVTSSPVRITVHSGTLLIAHAPKSHRTEGVPP